MEYFQPLQKGLDELQTMLYELKENTNLKGFISTFFERFNKIKEEIPPEYKAIRDFITKYGKKEDFLWVLDVDSFVEWEPSRGRFEECDKKYAHSKAVNRALQALVYGLIGQALEYLPKGKEAKSQSYLDLLDGFEKETEIKHFELGLRHMNDLIQKSDFDYDFRKTLSDWVNDHFAASLLDENVLEGLQLIQAKFLFGLEGMLKEVPKYNKKSRKGRLTLTERKEFEELLLAIKQTKKTIKEKFSKLTEYVEKKSNQYPTPTEWWDDYIIVEEPKIKERGVYKPGEPAEKMVVTELPLEKRIETMLSEKNMGAWELSEALKVPVVEVYGVLYGWEKMKKVTPVKDFWVLSKKENT